MAEKNIVSIIGLLFAVNYWEAIRYVGLISLGSKQASFQKGESIPHFCLKSLTKK